MVHCISPAGLCYRVSSTNCMARAVPRSCGSIAKHCACSGRLGYALNQLFSQGLTLQVFCVLLVGWRAASHHSLMDQLGPGSAALITAQLPMQLIMFKRLLFQSSAGVGHTCVKCIDLGQGSRCGCRSQPVLGKNAAGCGWCHVELSAVCSQQACACRGSCERSATSMVPWVLSVVHHKASDVSGRGHPAMPNATSRLCI